MNPLIPELEVRNPPDDWYIHDTTVAACVVLRGAQIMPFKATLGVIPVKTSAFNVVLAGV